MTDTDNTHNGWSNYATWRVNLEICDDLTSSMVGEQTFNSVYDLAEYLKDEIDDIISDCGEMEGPAVDYARAFLAEVNWYEIARHSADELVRSEEGDKE
jgi:hypothetical protein